MKKSDPCPHTFKCSNCQGDYQADSNHCSSGDTDLTGSGIKKNIPRSVKTDPRQFVLIWTVNANNNCEETQNSFAKHLQELLNH